MANIPSFYSNRKFYGDAHFPYGIDRSGEFTREQINLLMKHGWAYQALAEGSRAPVTPEEEAFVAVSRGEQVSETVHEKVWMLFCTKTSSPKAAVSFSLPLVGSKPLVEPSVETPLDDAAESSTF